LRSVAVTEPVPFAEWRTVLATVVGHETFDELEMRVSTRELVQLLGQPHSSQTTMRLGSIMRALGWTGPRPMRIGGPSIHGYTRPAPIPEPAKAKQAEPAPERETAAQRRGPPQIVRVVRDEGLVRQLERVCGLSLDKLQEILELPVDTENGNVLRAQTAAAGTVLQCQLRADETRFRAAHNNDVLDRLERLIRQVKKTLPKDVPKISLTPSQGAPD
jgi:hypothetical protein